MLSVWQREKRKHSVSQLMILLLPFSLDLQHLRSDFIPFVSHRTHFTLVFLLCGIVSPSEGRRYSVCPFSSSHFEHSSLSTVSLACPWLDSSLPLSTHSLRLLPFLIPSIPCLIVRIPYGFDVIDRG